MSYSFAAMKCYPQASAADIVAQEMASLAPGLSSREKNRAKRKAKLLAKQRSKDGGETSR